MSLMFAPLFWHPLPCPALYPRDCIDAIWRWWWMWWGCVIMQLYAIKLKFTHSWLSRHLVIIITAFTVWIYLRICRLQSCCLFMALPSNHLSVLVLLRCRWVRQEVRYWAVSLFSGSLVLCEVLCCGVAFRCWHTMMMMMMFPLSGWNSVYIYWINEKIVKKKMNVKM